MNENDSAQPEAAFVITLSDEGVACQQPDGQMEAVTWDDLQAVIVETNDEGPMVMDVYWLLVGKNGGCVIPQGASGEDELLSRLQVLEGFDNAALIEAMGSTENRRFLCWKRK